MPDGVWGVTAAARPGNPQKLRRPGARVVGGLRACARACEVGRRGAREARARRFANLHTAASRREADAQRWRPNLLAPVTASVAPSVAPSIAGDLNDDTRSEAGSVATLPPTDLGTWEKDSHTGVNAKDAADPGEPAPGEPRTVTLKRLAEAAAAAHASVAVGGGGGGSAHGADSPAGSDSGIGSGVTAVTTADGEHNRAVVATSPGDSTGGAHAPPPTHVDRPPSHIPPASVASASVASGHSPRSSHPTTPTRGGPRGSGLSARYVSTHHRVAFHTHQLPLINYHPITDISLPYYSPAASEPPSPRGSYIPASTPRKQSSDPVFPGTCRTTERRWSSAVDRAGCHGRESGAATAGASSRLYRWR